MRSRNEVMTPDVVQGVPVDGMLPDDRAALQALIDAAYRKAPKLRSKLNDEAPSNAAHWHKVAMDAQAGVADLQREVARLKVENARLAEETMRLQGLLNAAHQIVGELARPSGI